MSCLGYCPPTSNTHCRRAVPAAAAPLGNVPVRRGALLGRLPLRLGGLAVDLAPFASHADKAAPVPVLDLPPARGGGGPRTQQGQEQGHEWPEQGGQDAPPLGELLEGQQPEQGENAGDRHTKQTFFDFLGAPMDEQHERHDEPDQAVPLLRSAARRTASKTTALGAARLEGALLGPECWPTRAGLRGNVASKASLPGLRGNIASKTGLPGLRGGRGETKSVRRRTRKGSRRPSCAERLTSASTPEQPRRR